MTEEKDIMYIAEHDTYVCMLCGEAGELWKPYNRKGQQLQHECEKEEK